MPEIDLGKSRITFVTIGTALVLFFVSPVHSQSDPGKVEIGAHFVYLRMSDFRSSENQPGIGGRVTFNLNRSVSVEGEMSYLPVRHPSSPGSGFVAQHAVQGLFGVKAGRRWRRFGLFGKLRPGFVRFNDLAEGVACIQAIPFSFACVPRDTTKFAIDYGGVAEYYPNKKAVIRFDVGNTMIRFGNERAAIATFYSNNLQIGAGVGFRF